MLNNGIEKKSITERIKKLESTGLNHETRYSGHKTDIIS